ncbi:hypothetical protein HPB51_003058 [Rhipicephalus microplus]|uniref:SMC hinge domain-containing protein n=1 Tax=Rhipicephalus microplus TaxID=6941 RepID=A0A9J6D8N6_RHIMP|nr:hypothetical protein HPB51_003058 [Rhipicephalus microplus]
MFANAMILPAKFLAKLGLATTREEISVVMRVVVVLDVSKFVMLNWMHAAVPPPLFLQCPGRPLIQWRKGCPALRVYIDAAAWDAMPQLKKALLLNTLGVEGLNFYPCAVEDETTSAVDHAIMADTVQDVYAATLQQLDTIVDEQVDRDAIPMISKLNFDPKFESAMKYIYGKTLICRNLEVATQIARTSNLDCITLDGDQVSHKGALTGGYFDTRRSRLDLHKAHMQLMKEITEVEKQLAEHKQKLADILTINQVVSDMQKAETKNSKNKDVFDKLKADIRLMKEELTALERSKQPKERSLASLDSSLKSMESTEQSLRSELQQDLLTQLSVTDQQEVDRLNDEIRRLTQENKEAFSERMRKLRQRAPNQIYCAILMISKEVAPNCAKV